MKTKMTIFAIALVLGIATFSALNMNNHSVVKAAPAFFGDTCKNVKFTVKNQHNSGGKIEIRGVVSDRTATTLAINGQVVNTVGAIIDAPGGVISNGNFVEAKGTVVNGGGELVAEGEQA